MTEPDTAPKPRQFNAMLWVVLPFLLVVIGAVVVAGIQVGSTSDEDTARETCRSAVAKQLKAPSTAQWPGDSVYEEPPGRFAVEGSVDAQNSFGAMVRTGYSCTVDVDGDFAQLVDVAVH
jgi:hypothetical protein